MSENECPYCAEAESRCAKLERENDKLKRENEKLKRRIKKLEELLKRIREYCWGVVKRTDKILSQRSGISRGQWSFAKGARGVAEAILSYLG